jgi:hypothetical protein
MDRVFNGSQYHQVEAFDEPHVIVVLHESDITPTPCSQDLQRCREALKAIGERNQVPWETVVNLAAEAIGHPLLPEEMDLEQLATAQAAVRAYIKRSFGLGAAR